MGQGLGLSQQIGDKAGPKIFWRGLETSIHLPGCSQSVQGRTRGSLTPEKERFEADLPSQGSGSKGREK